LATSGVSTFDVVSIEVGGRVFDSNAFITILDRDVVNDVAVARHVKAICFTDVIRCDCNVVEQVVVANNGDVEHGRVDQINVVHLNVVAVLKTNQSRTAGICRKIVTRSPQSAISVDGSSTIENDVVSIVPLKNGSSKIRVENEINSSNQLQGPTGTPEGHIGLYSPCASRNEKGRARIFRNTFIVGRSNRRPNVRGALNCAV